MHQRQFEYYWKNGICIPNTDKYLKELNLKVGQTWYVKLPFIPVLSERKIINLTKETVLLLEKNNTFEKESRYKILDIEFVEKISEEDRFKQYLGKKLEGRIKVGAIIGQDHRYLTWPECFPPKFEFEKESDYEYKTRFPDRIFDIMLFNNGTEETPRYSWKCITDGFGNLEKPNSYGSGAIYVNNPDDVILLNS